ncbi:epoxide hydrolase [Diaporthe eres]|nr:epoxide hydrolase [Diaporthe eres]
MDVLAEINARFRYQTANLNGVQHNYIYAEPAEEAAGTVFLVHGWPDLALGWVNHIPLLLSKGFSVVALDMMGTFKRASDDIAALAKKLDLSRIILGGHDWGGGVVYRAAMWHPELVAAFYCTNTPLVPPQAAHTDMAHSWSGFHYQLQLRTNTIQDYLGPVGQQDATRVRKLLNAIYGVTGSTGKLAIDVTGEGLDFGLLEGVNGDTPLLTKKQIDYFVESFTKNPFNNTLNWYRTSERNWEEELPLVPGNIKYTSKLSQPALFIAATLDPTLPPVLSEGMEAYFDNLTRGEVNGGHRARWEKPDEIDSESAGVSKPDHAGW